jgi:hypothetical protein
MRTVLPLLGVNPIAVKNISYRTINTYIHTHTHVEHILALLPDFQVTNLSLDEKITLMWTLQKQSVMGKIGLNWLRVKIPWLTSETRVPIESSICSISVVTINIAKNYMAL